MRVGVLRFEGTPSSSFASSPFFLSCLFFSSSPRGSPGERSRVKKERGRKEQFSTLSFFLCWEGEVPRGAFRVLSLLYGDTSPPPFPSPQCIKLILLLSTKRKDLGKGKGEVGGRSASPLLSHSPFASLAPAVFYSPFPRKPALGLRQFLPRLVSVRGSYCS